MANFQEKQTVGGCRKRIDDSIIEKVRRERAMELNTNAGARAELAAKYGQVWDTEELANDFEIIGFAAPYVVVRCRQDGRRGSLEFQHHPRFYFSFEEDK